MLLFNMYHKLQFKLFHKLQFKLFHKLQLFNNQLLLQDNHLSTNHTEENQPLNKSHSKENMLIMNK